MQGRDALSREGLIDHIDFRPSPVINCRPECCSAARQTGLSLHLRSQIRLGYLRKSSIGSFSKSASATPSASLSVLNRSPGIKEVPFALVISNIHSGSSTPR